MQPVGPNRIFVQNVADSMSSYCQIRLLTTVSFFPQGDSPYGQKEAYIKLEQLGEGSYATVFKGYSK